MDLWLEIVLTVQNRNGCLTTHTFSGTTYGVDMEYFRSMFSAHRRTKIQRPHELNWTVQIHRFSNLHMTSMCLCIAVLWKIKVHTSKNDRLRKLSNMVCFKCKRQTFRSTYSNRTLKVFENFVALKGQKAQSGTSWCHTPFVTHSFIHWFGSCTIISNVLILKVIHSQSGINRINRSERKILPISFNRRNGKALEGKNRKRKVKSGMQIYKL